VRTCACWSPGIVGRRIGGMSVPRLCDCLAVSEVSTERHMGPLGWRKRRDKLRRCCVSCSFEAAADRAKYCDGIGLRGSCDRRLEESAA
jgi:hypothetical protein